MITVAHRPVVRRCIPAVLGIALLVAWLAPGLAAPAPAQGMLLVASPDMRGTWFSRSVILLIQHDELGSVGLVINRPTEIAPADMLPEVAGLESLRGKLYIGGPVEGHGVMMLVRSDSAPADAEHIFANVYASGSPDLLDDTLRREDAANRLRLYAGYAGWVPGQLEAEIRRGSWIVVQADQEHVFSSEPDEIWERLVPANEPIIVMRDMPGRLVAFDML
ncbi:MAG: YqgE/AlgH family protein [Gammaproteobacteria bacterium]